MRRLRCASTAIGPRPRANGVMHAIASSIRPSRRSMLDRRSRACGSFGEIASARVTSCSAATWFPSRAFARARVRWPRKLFGNTRNNSSAAASAAAASPDSKSRSIRTMGDSRAIETSYRRSIRPRTHDFANATQRKAPRSKLRGASIGSRCALRRADYLRRRDPTRPATPRSASAPGAGIPLVRSRI